jgi:CIC family chloride channel protein
MRTFSKAESDALAVIDDFTHKQVVGLLTEQHSLRKYSEELDRRANEGVIA